MQELREHVKHWTQSILNRIGYRITKVDTVDPFQPLLFYLRQKTRDFFFVQIGAFDGIMFDPIYDFVLQHTTVRLISKQF
jgi:hypothetical protein